MNTEKMSHIVSMTTNVGVLIGLSLLVYELNQNNQQLQEQAEFVAVENRVNLLRSFGESAEIRRLVYGHAAEEALTEVDNLGRQDFFSSVFVQWQWEFERERTGLTHQYDSMEHMASVYRFAVQRWGVEDLWSARKQVYGADFVEFMDTQVIGPG